MLGLLEGVPMIQQCNCLAGDETAGSLGYDKVRFLGPSTSATPDKA